MVCPDATGAIVHGVRHDILQTVALKTVEPNAGCIWPGIVGIEDHRLLRRQPAAQNRRINCTGAIADGLDHYAKCIGLAFQIRDDVLDVEGDTATLGKPQGSDAALAKPTYPTLLGLTESKRLAAELVDDAVASLDGLGDGAEPLRQLARYIVARSH